MHDTILQSVGRTPLVKLRCLAEGIQPSIYVKVESHNPGGSVKDRVAVAMIAEAERRGWLRPGGTIIEATAGNTGVGLAMVAAVKGYRCIFVLPDKMSQEKVLLLKAYGAEVVITPTSVPPDSPDSYNGVADRLAREIPGAWRPNQFSNMANPEIHYHATGPEIWEQTDGRVTVFVAGVGTGGTISGVARYLKERNPEIKIVGADPEGSVLSGGAPHAWKVEGIGEDFVPKTFNGQLVDDWVRISDAESFQVARGLARREGILAGGSSGTNVAAALRYARRLTGEHLIVTMVCDTGRNYLSKLFNDTWLAENNLLSNVQPTYSIADLLRTRGGRQLVTIQPDATAAAAIDLMGKKKEGPTGNEQKSNITDPESAKMASSRGVIQGYNGLAVVDDRAQIVVHAEARGSGYEAHLLVPLLEATRETFGLLDPGKDVFAKAKVTADSGFHSRAVVAAVERTGADVYIADRNYRRRDPAFADAGRHKEREKKERELERRKQKEAQPAKKKLFSLRDFFYDEGKALCICPAGHKLYHSGKHMLFNGYRVAYFKAPITACRDCPLRARCLRHPERTPQRQICIIKGREGVKRPDKRNSAAERMRWKFDTPRGREIYSRRMGTVEPVFANLQNKGMRRFTLRGRAKVDAQWQLFTMVHNIEKIARKKAN